MGVVISFANHKGGVGKTSTCVNYGAVLAQAGKRVLQINFDGQKSLQNYIENNCNQSIVEAISQGLSLEKIIGNTYIKGLDIISSNKSLELELRNLKKEKHTFFKWLEKEIIPLKSRYDFILIDTAPSLSLGLVLALFASDYVIIPTEVTQEGIESVESIIETIQSLKADFEINHPQILGVIPNKVMKICKKSNQEILDELNHRYRLLPTIYWSNDFNKAMKDKKAVIDYNPSNISLSAIRTTFQTIGVSI